MMHCFDPRHFSRAMLIATLISPLSLLGGCSQSVPDIIKIGVALPVSGPVAALGQDLMDGAILAVEELNNQGFRVDDKAVKFEILAVDDKSDPETGKMVAQQLVDARVTAAIGHLNSGVSIPAAPIYAAADTAQFSMASNPKLTALGLKTPLRLVANDDLQARAMGGYAANVPGATKFAVLDDGTTYGVGLAEGAAARLTELEQNVVVRQSFDGTTVEFDALAASIKTSGVNVITSTLNDFQVVALVKALGKIDYTNVTVVGGGTIRTNAMTKASGLVSQITATSAVLSVKEFPAGAEFQAKFLERFKRPVTYGAHYTYDAVYVMASAIRSARSADPKKVLAELRKHEYFGPVTGTTRWDDKGELRHGAVGVYELRERTWELRTRSTNW